MERATTMTKRLTVLSFAALWLLASGAAAPSSSVTPARRIATGVYTNLRYVPEADDLVGYEVFILFGNGHHWALLQVAEGAPAEPHLVPVTITDDTLDFPFPSFGPEAVFKGRVTTKGLEGTILGRTPPVTLRLPRGRSYWQSK